MKKFLALFIRHWAKGPGKLLLTLFAVALGTGILILSFSTSMILKEQITDQLHQGGSVLFVANGEWGADGEIDQERPPQWDSEAPANVVAYGGTISYAAPVVIPNIDEITVGNSSYTLRSAVATAPEYFEIMGLDIVAGVYMTDTDIEQGGVKKVWISQEMAEMLFGSSEEAIGKFVIPPGQKISRGLGRNQEQNLITQYRVAGVFSSPSEVARRSFGIGDVIFPYTSQIPPEMNLQVMKNYMSGIFAVKSSESSVEKVQAEVGQILTTLYGDDVSVTVWEGNPKGVSTYQEELRQAVTIFSVSVNILGIVLLLTSSLGIFSIMVVEALSRRRDIALERALGASQLQVVKEFWSWSFLLSCLGAILGVVFSLILAKPVLNTIVPLVGEFSGDTALHLSPLAVLGGVSLALVCGGILGLLPAFSAVKGHIADVLREG